MGHESNESTMTLRRKILLIITAAAVVLILGLSGTLVTLLLRGFGRLEEQAVERSVQQATDAFRVQLRGLEEIAASWAADDELCEQITRGDLAFFQAKYRDESFAKLGLSLAVFVHPSSRVIYQKGFDVARGKERPVPAGFARWLSPASPLLLHRDAESVRSGIVEVPEGLLMVVSRPIVAQNRLGAIHGTLIVGRFVDRRVAARIARLTQLPVALQPVRRQELPPEFVMARDDLLPPERVTAQVLDEHWVAGYAELNDVRGKPVALLQVRMPREVHLYGRRIVLYLAGALVAMGLVSVALTIWLLERYVLGRVERLAVSVDQIASTGNLQSRVPVAGADELAALANAINGMLAALDGSQSALRESQRMLATLMSNLPGMAYRCRPDEHWTMEFVSEGCRGLTGYAPADLVGNCKVAFADLIEPEDLELVRREVNEGVTAGRSFRITYRIRAADGQRKWVFEQGCAVRDATGAVVALEGFISDITDQKKSEASLRESEEMFRSLSASSPVGVFVADILGAWIYVNPRLRALTGRGLMDCLGEGWVASVLPAERESLVQEWREFVRQGGAFDREFRIRGANDRVRWVHLRCSPMLSDRGQAVGFVGTVEDVTERNEMTAALQQSQQRLQDLFENSPDAIFVEDYNGTVLDVNPAACALHGMKREELVGRNVLDLVPPERREEVRREYARFITGESEYAEGISVSRGGRHVPVELKVRRVSYEGQPALLLHIRDVTARKQLEQQFLQAQKFEAIGRLAGGVAHDFNNILTAIIGYTELMLRRLGPDSPLRRQAEEVLKAAQRAADLTRQLLAYSRKQQLQPRVLDLNTVLAEMDKMLRRVIGEHIELVLVTAPDLGAVEADPSQIQQVVLNFAVNARDAMPDNGRLTIETRNAVVDAVMAEQHEVLPGEYVTLAVSDTGAGMSEEVRAHLFEPFFTTKGVGQGTGLGLATCAGIVHQSGGFITVDSQVGRGSTFRIYLPRVAARAPVEDFGGPPAELPAGHETVLVVEDEPAVRELAVTALREQGYVVHEAGNGDEAWRRLQQDGGLRIDLLLTDVVMPLMNGKELADRLHREQPGVKVLFMSGYTDEAIIHHGVLAAGVAFLNKPFTGQVLLRKVREVLDQTPSPA